MMRLSTLWAVHGTRSAADEPGPLAQQIAERWEHDRDSLRFVRSSANSVYRFDAAGTRRFLRFASGAERARKLIEAEVDLLEWLVGRGAAVARPAPSKTGSMVETVATDAGVFYAVAFDRLEGEPLEIGYLDRRQFERWGATLGRLHATVDDYVGSALEARPSWREQLHGAMAYIPEQESAVRRELDEITAALEALPADGERCGLIHGDFELDNLRWPDDGDGVVGTVGALGVLDFDDCARHWYAADIAFALRDLFDAGEDPGDESVTTFLRGYRTHRPLHAEPLAALPLFSRLSRLLSYTTNVRTLDLPDSADHPEWLRGLRRKFEAHATEDKDDVVRPLANALVAEGLRVWYDEFELRIGDSLRRKIDRGLATSRFGVVVLSHAFFAKNWPQYELDGLVTREMTGEQIILPLWHGISKSEVIARSPSLADKLARNTSDFTVEEIAREIAHVINTPR